MCHDHNLPLIVDEAHGGHFHPAGEQLPGSFPQGALQCGADIVVQSTHKVLTSMTQTAMLHVHGDLVSADRVTRALQVGREGVW